MAGTEFYPHDGILEGGGLARYVIFPNFALHCCNGNGAVTYLLVLCDVARPFNEPTNYRFFGKLLNKPDRIITNLLCHAVAEAWPAERILEDLEILLREEEEEDQLERAPAGVGLQQEESRLPMKAD
jgi:hypothetical protein